MLTKAAVAVSEDRSTKWRQEVRMTIHNEMVSFLQARTTIMFVSHPSSHKGDEIDNMWNWSVVHKQAPQYILFRTLSIIQLGRLVTTLNSSVVYTRAKIHLPGMCFSHPSDYADRWDWAQISSQVFLQLAAQWCELSAHAHPPPRFTPRSMLRYPPDRQQLINHLLPTT